MHYFNAREIKKDPKFFICRLGEQEISEEISKKNKNCNKRKLESTG